MAFKRVLFSLLLGFHAAKPARAQECPPYFADQKTRSDPKTPASILCRYQGPYPMGTGGMDSWQQVPYVPFLDSGIPLGLIDLGKDLFFDPNLSLKRNLSCAQCHEPTKAFTDQKELALDADQKPLRRNTPTLFNVVFLKRLFWDGRSYSLFDQAFHPLLDPQEMGLTPALLFERVRENKSHWHKIVAASTDPSFALFDQKVRETYQLNPPGESLSARILRTQDSQDPMVPEVGVLKTVGLALVAYQSTLLSFDSPFDRWFLGKTPSLPPSQWRGFNVFRSFVTRCAECHIPPLFTSRQLVVIGAPDNPRRKNDFGEYHQHPDPLLKGSFKVPTLRNIATTAPYMHSGALGTLKQVIDFYHRGEGRTLAENRVPGLHWHIRPLELSNAEKKDLENFLEALTDSKYEKKSP